MNALLLIDIQNDFLPGGALAVPRGDEVVPIANRLMPQYPLAIATQDWHPSDHQSFASQHPGKAVGDAVIVEGLDQILWPDHCIQGSRGAEFAVGLDVDGIHHVVRKGTQRTIDSYSGFYDNARRSATGLGELVQRHGVTEVDVMGLALDYCVKFTALDAVDLGLNTRLLTAGSRGIERSPGDCAAAIDQMREAGVVIVGEPT